MKISHLFLLLGLWYTPASLSFGKMDYLAGCWEKQGQNLQHRCLSISYRESINQLYHSMTPWQTYRMAPHGRFWINTDRFTKHDTMSEKKTDYYSEIEFDTRDLLMIDYGDTALQAVTPGDIAAYNLESARYSPLLLLQYFLERKIPESTESNAEFAVYQAGIGKTIVKIFIRKIDNLLEKVTMLSSEEILGDVINSFHYNNYSDLEGIYYAKNILIEKKNSFVHDTVTIISADLTSMPPSLLKKPDNFTIRQDEMQTGDSIAINKYSDHIHFVTFKHADSKAMVVEFNTFLLVAESPLSSSNGEQLIRAAESTAPGKPIKYFSYGHWHPWYLGGMRPFIHHGAKIICPECDSEYVTYLAKSKHTLQPDSLQMDPKVLQSELFSDSLVISDGNYSMVIYHIGKESGHTQDYSIFYLPNEKMIFEGDLAWIKKDALPAKPGAQQTGLYAAIKKRGLDVTTINQSWPISNYGVKSVFQFADLEAAMNVK